jgi:hypothetical protein
LAATLDQLSAMAGQADLIDRLSLADYPRNIKSQVFWLQMDSPLLMRLVIHRVGKWIVTNGKSAFDPKPR